MTKTYTISNIAGGDLRTFRTDRDGSPSVASIRHAERQGSMGFICSDQEIDKLITSAINGYDDEDLVEEYSR